MSFMFYLVENYGEEAVVAWLVSSSKDFVPLEKSRSELLREWQAYIIARCENF